MKKKLTMALLVFAVMLSMPLVIGAYSEESDAAEAQVGSLNLTGDVIIPDGGYLIDAGSELSIGDNFTLTGNGTSIKMEAGSTVSFMGIMTREVINDVEIIVDGEVSMLSVIDILGQEFNVELNMSGNVEVKVSSVSVDGNAEEMSVKFDRLTLNAKLTEEGAIDIDLGVGVSEVALTSNGSTATAKDVDVNADMLIDIPETNTTLMQYTGDIDASVSIGSFEISNGTDVLSANDIKAEIEVRNNEETDYFLNMTTSIGSASYNSKTDSADEQNNVSIILEGMSANVRVMSSLDTNDATDYAGMIDVDLSVDNFSLNNTSTSPTFSYKNIIEVNGLKANGEISYYISGQTMTLKSDSSSTKATLERGYYLQSSTFEGIESGYEATLSNVSAGLTMDADFSEVVEYATDSSGDTTVVIPTSSYMIQSGEISVNADIGYLNMKSDGMTTLQLEGVNGNITIDYAEGINQSETITAEGGVISYHIGEADWEFQDAKFNMNESEAGRTNSIEAERAIKTYVDDDGNTVKEYYVDVTGVNDGEPVGTQVDGFDEPTDNTMIYAAVIVVVIVVIAAAAILIKKRKGAGEA